MPAVKTMNLNDFLDLPSSEQRKFLFDARIFRGNFDTVAWEWWPQADWSHCWILLVWYFARHVRQYVRYLFWYPYSRLRLWRRYARLSRYEGKSRTVALACKVYGEVLWCICALIAGCCCSCNWEVRCSARRSFWTQWRRRGRPGDGRDIPGAWAVGGGDASQEVVVGGSR